MEVTASLNRAQLRVCRRCQPVDIGTPRSLGDRRVHPSPSEDNKASLWLTHQTRQAGISQNRITTHHHTHEVKQEETGARQGEGEVR